MTPDDRAEEPTSVPGAATSADNTVHPGGETAPAAKKRKRSPRKKQDAAAIKCSTPPPTSILLIDNGGDTLKYGWSTDTSPQRLPNVTARLQHQWTVLVGDELDRVQPNQLEALVRSTERGYITNLGNQIQVWKRLLDHLRVSVPQNTEAAQTFGWKIARTAPHQPTTNGSKPLISPQSLAVMILLPPHCPRVVLEQIMYVWFEEFQVARVGFALASVCASRLMASTTECRCTVDVGWSATQIVPTYQHKILDPTSIRRIPLGGRHLINMWKYYTSYRQWNLMDQEKILRDVLHQLGYVALDFDHELKLARDVPLGKRPYDRNYILPDYQKTYSGRVEMPRALEKETIDVKEVPTPRATSIPEASENADTSDQEVDKSETVDDEKSDEDSDEEETAEEIRSRILKQREAEERRRREEELEHQILQVSAERFTIPEVLFHPTDAGLAPDLAGLPQAICASISGCPMIYQAALYGSIHLTGGVSQLPNFKNRLEREVRSLAPAQYDVRVQLSDSPIEDAWLGAKKSLMHHPCEHWSISRMEYDSKRKDRKVWHGLLHSEGGLLL